MSMKHKCFSIEYLKVLACMSMLLDHIGAVFYPSMLLRAVGRVAFPLFCFALCQGFYHTRNRRKYLLRLGLCAILAEPFFDFLFWGGLSFAGQNVLLTLFFGLVMAIFMGKTENPLWKLIIIVPFYFLAELLRTDYAGGGILTVALFILTYNKRGALLLQTVGLVLIQLYMNSAVVHVWGVSIPLQLFGVGAMVPIALYSGKKLTHAKAVQWLFYLFYPAHMALFCLIIKICGNPL